MVVDEPLFLVSPYSSICSQRLIELTVVRGLVPCRPGMNSVVGFGEDLLAELVGEGEEAGACFGR